MAKFGIGESVRFKAPELLVPAGLVGRITGSVETTGEETKYYVDVKLPRSLSASASGILGILGSSDVTLKLSVLESKLQSEKEYFGSKIDEFIKRIIPSYNPDPDSWIRSFLDNCDPCIKKSFDATINLKRWKPVHTFLYFDFAFPMTKDIIEENEKKFNEYARNIMKGVDPAVPGGDKNGVSVVDGKMSKSRCVKLLESYRAEREKIKKGRKFERCLRDSVVDEALERAIELLKGGAE